MNTLVVIPASEMTDAEFGAHVAYSHQELPRDAWRLAHERAHRRGDQNGYCDHVHRAMEDVPVGELL